MTNIGLDFSVLKSRISGSIDYYIKNTSDLIFNHQVPNTVYFTNSMTANVGKVKNTGVEVTANRYTGSNQGFQLDYFFKRFS